MSGIAVKQQHKMCDYIFANLDYLFFVHGLAFLILAFSAYFANKLRGDSSLNLGWLGIFAILRCLHAWADMVAIACNEPLFLEKIRLICHTVSFICLCEFGRSNLERQGIFIGRWLLFALLWPTLFAAILQPAAVNAIVRYTLGLGGGLGAATAFFMAAPRAAHGSRIFRFSAAAMLLYALVTPLPPLAPFFPAAVLNQEWFCQITGLPVQAVRCALMLCLAGAMWRYFRCYRLASAAPLQPVHRSISLFVHFAFLFVIAGGGAMTHYLGKIAERTVRHEIMYQHYLASAHLQKTMHHIKRFGALLAGEPAVVAALTDRTPASMMAVNSELDRFQVILGEAICYLLDRTGMTIASSNRDSPSSFVGKTYAFRPYFQDALAGGVGHYFALGVTSQQRGFYVGQPVRAKTGEIVGVAVIKISVDEFEKKLPSSISCGVLSPNGVIFLANKPEMILRTLGPLNAKEQQEIIASQQFGKGPFRPLFTSMPQSEQVCDHGGKKMLFHATAGPLPDWRIFSLEIPGLQLASYRLLAIAATLLCALLLLLGYSVWQILLRAANDLAISEERYRMLVEDQTEFICRLSPEGRIIFANETLCRYLGLSRAEVVGACFLPGISAAENARLAAVYGRVSTLRPVVAHEDLIILPNGQQRWLQWTFRGLIKNGEIAELHAVGRDVSDRKAAEEAVIRSERLAAVGTLATGVAHHYNNLNMSVLGYAEMALNQKGLPPTIERWLKNIHQSALRIRDITNNLLILSRPADSLLKAENLNEIIQRALSLFSALFEKENIKVVCRLGELPLRHMDAAQIQQCLVHLLTNAYHALLDRKEKRIEIETSVENEAIVARISDTGCGIPPDRLTHIFTPFYSTKGEHASRGSPMARVRGVGLGLSVTQAIIKKHGGEIVVQSEAGKGTIVTIHLPVRCE